MMSLTRENGVTIRLDAEYDVEKETARYTVSYNGTKMYFAEFQKAAMFYKSLCAELRMGCDMKVRIATMDKLYGKNGEMTKLLWGEVA